MATPEPQYRTTSRTTTRTVKEIANELGISERAVLKRISTGRLAAKREGRSWRVIVIAPPRAAPSTERSSPVSAEHTAQSPNNASKSGTVDGTVTGAEPQTTNAQAQMAAIMSQWLSPLTARIESLAGENGELRADLRHERQQRALIERERDELQARVDAIAEQARTDTTATTTLPDAPTTGTQPRRSWLRRFFGME